MSEDSWVWAGRELDRICGVIKKNMDRHGTGLSIGLRPPTADTGLRKR
ncbi:MAG: hypothetical protein ACLTBV_11375 [Enterocloster bolteae]